MILITIIAVAVFSLSFYQRGISKDPYDWQIFAVYCSGILSPIFTTITILLILKQLENQKKETSKLHCLKNIEKICGTIDDRLNQPIPTRPSEYFIMRNFSWYPMREDIVSSIIQRTSERLRSTNSSGRTKANELLKTKGGTNLLINLKLPSLLDTLITLLDRYLSLLEETDYEVVESILCYYRTHIYDLSLMGVMTSDKLEKLNKKLYKIQEKVREKEKRDTI